MLQCEVTGGRVGRKEVSLVFKGREALLFNIDIIKIDIVAEAVDITELYNDIIVFPATYPVGRQYLQPIDGGWYKFGAVSVSVVRNDTPPFYKLM